MRAQINGAQRFSDPPCLSIFKRREGVRDRGCSSPTVQISAPGSTTVKSSSDPPRLSTFKRRGGGPGSHVQLSDGQNRSTQINGARVALPLLAIRCLTSVGPPPVISFFFCLSPAAMCHPLTSPQWSSWPSFLPPSTPFSPRVPIPFHVGFSPKVPHILPTYLGVLRHGPSSATPLFHHHHFSPPLPRAPRCRHTHHAPCPPHWPSCSSFKISCYSRWQSEKSSGSRNAELAGPLSIPRSSYRGS